MLARFEKEKTEMTPVKNKLSKRKIVQTQMAALWILKV